MDLFGFVVKTSVQEGLIINQSQQIGGLITHGHRITERVQVEHASKRFVLAVPRLVLAKVHTISLRYNFFISVPEDWVEFMSYLLYAF